MIRDFERKDDKPGKLGDEMKKRDNDIVIPYRQALTELVELQLVMTTVD